MAKNQRRKSRGFRNSSGKFVPDYYAQINTKTVDLPKDLPLFMQAKDIKETFRENGLVAER
ncbi:hypothetical protein IJ674_10300 [bacterium]|nr:hypothetical protein [bacterium]